MVNISIHTVKIVVMYSNGIAYSSFRSLYSRSYSISVINIDRKEKQDTAMSINKYLLK
jgi:hypothetical protein